MEQRQIRAPMAATVLQLAVAVGQQVRAGEPLLILEAMKMEHELTAPHDARVVAVLTREGELVGEGDALPQLESVQIAPASAPGATPQAPSSAQRADLQQVLARQAATLDAARPDAAQRRHALGLRTARENIDDLCDAGSFSEYGALAIAAQRARRSYDDLVKHTPGDGMVTGIGSINELRCGVDRL